MRLAEGRVNVRDQVGLIRAILADCRAGRGGTVFTLNLDHLVKLRGNGRFRAAYQRASYVSVDGAPIVGMARDLGVSLQLVTGSDLVVPLCEAAAGAGVPVFLFGASDTVRQAASARLRAVAPTLRVAGAESPPHGFDPEGSAAREAAARIAASGAGICFVALGAPKQELFANIAVAHAPQVVFVCVGAALDFLAGSVRRAPPRWRRLGLEWMWRLLHEPKRLAARYGRSLLYYLGYRLRGPDDRMLRVDRRQAGPQHSPIRHL
ncbi:MAG: WecB/TagA/CpsF family glycosyltransferase [Rhizobiales bacterium]|nr:WecB/TagA/CpsF family glycosyltransferase [Hyphomicrobiales bacterium]